MGQQLDPRFWNKSFDDLEIVKKKDLGKGGYASVKLGRLKGDPHLYAVKIIDLSLLSAKEHDHMRKEIKTHAMMRHPNIIRFYHLLEHEEKLYMLLEYAPNGDLYRYIVDKERFSEKDACKIVAQVALALQYIHNKGVLHRDLKPENILLDENFVVKVSDFGWCGEYKRQQRRSIGGVPAHRVTFCGTYEYMAPEVIRGDHQDEKVDVWSLGILLYELLHGKTPFRSNAPLEIQRNIVEGKFNIDKRLGPVAIDLVRRILRANPADRYSVKQVLAHPFITVARFYQTHIPNIDEFQFEEEEEEQSLNPDIDDNLPTGEDANSSLTKDVKIAKGLPLPKVSSSTHVAKTDIVHQPLLPNSSDRPAKLLSNKTPPHTVKVVRSLVVAPTHKSKPDPKVTESVAIWDSPSKSHLHEPSAATDRPLLNTAPREQSGLSTEKKRPESEARRKLEALRNQILNNRSKNKPAEGGTVIDNPVMVTSVYQPANISPEERPVNTSSLAKLDTVSSASKLSRLSPEKKRSEKVLATTSALARLTKESRQSGSFSNESSLTTIRNEATGGVRSYRCELSQNRPQPHTLSHPVQPLSLSKRALPLETPSQTLRSERLLGLNKQSASQEKLAESMKFARNELSSTMANKSLGLIEGLHSQLQRKLSSSTISKQSVLRPRGTPTETESPRLHSKTKVNLYSNRDEKSSQGGRSLEPDHLQTQSSVYHKLSLESKRLLSASRLHTRVVSGSADTSNSLSQKLPSANIYTETTVGRKN